MPTARDRRRTGAVRSGLRQRSPRHRWTPFPAVGPPRECLAVLVCRRSPIAGPRPGIGDARRRAPRGPPPPFYEVLYRNLQHPRIRSRAGLLPRPRLPPRRKHRVLPPRRWGHGRLLQAPHSTSRMKAVFADLVSRIFALLASLASPALQEK